MFLHFQYSEMLDLEGMKSMELDFPNQKKVMPVYTLKLSTDVVQLKVMADYFFFSLFSCLPHYGDMTKANMSAPCFLDGQRWHRRGLAVFHPDCGYSKSKYTLVCSELGVGLLAQLLWTVLDTIMISPVFTMSDYEELAWLLIRDFYGLPNKQGSMYLQTERNYPKSFSCMWQGTLVHSYWIFFFFLRRQHCVLLLKVSMLYWIYWIIRSLFSLQISRKQNI